MSLNWNYFNVNTVYLSIGSTSICSSFSFFLLPHSLLHSIYGSVYFSLFPSFSLPAWRIKCSTIEYNELITNNSFHNWVCVCVRARVIPSTVLLVGNYGDTKNINTRNLKMNCFNLVPNQAFSVVSTLYLYTLSESMGSIYLSCLSI